MATSNRRVGFTLIELLVVVAIISLLVSILLPSLHAAKRLAWDAVCKSNLRTVFLAQLFYANDHNDTLRPGIMSNAVTPFSEWCRYLASAQAGYLGWSVQSQWEGDTPIPPSLVCPEAGNAMSKISKGWFSPDAGSGRYRCTYVSHENVVGVQWGAGGHNWRKLGDQPSTRALLFEKTDVKVGDGNLDHSESHLRILGWMDPRPYLALGWLSLRHSGDLANIGYIDGHVSTISYDEYDRAIAPDGVSWPYDKWYDNLPN